MKFENQAELNNPRELLEQQFNNPEAVEIDGEKIEIIDIKPKEQKTEVPLVMVPGWSATPEVLKENIISLAEMSRRVIATSAPHGIKPEEANPNYPIPELRKTAALIKCIDEKGLNKVDAVSHSEAGIFTTIAAMENSDKFRNLVFVSPAGMIGKDTVPRLTRDFSLDIAGQTVKGLFKEQHRLGKIATAYLEALKATIQDPKKTWEEIVSMTKFEIPELLKELKEQGHGIIIIHGVNDKAFPMKKMQEQTSSEIVDGFYSVKGSHNEMYLKPHPFTELIDQALNALEKKHKK